MFKDHELWSKFHFGELYNLKMQCLFYTRMVVTQMWNTTLRKIMITVFRSTRNWNGWVSNHNPSLIEEALQGPVKISN